MTLRAMTEDDLLMVLAWRNSPAVRAAMFHQHLISEDEHRAWFQRICTDDRTVCLIYETDTQGPCGFVNISQINKTNGTAFWGFYVAPDAIKGTGSGLGREVLRYVFGTLQLRKLNAEVLADNQKSLNFHQRLGFLQEGCFRDEHAAGDHYIDVYRYALTCDQWAGQATDSAHRTVPSEH